MNFSDYIIYVDESGDHSLEPVDPEYPVFVLVFCIFKISDYANTVVPRVETFKFKHFGHDAVILHERHIRKQEHPFEFLQAQEKRNAFMEEINCLVDNFEFTVIATVIKKLELNEKYVRPPNPYDLALLFCLERAFEFLREKNQHCHVTHLILEKRGRKEDDKLELTFRRICENENYRRKKFNFRILFASKSINSTGLQIADMIARPIGLNILRPNQTNRSWNIIRKKIRTDRSGKMSGWGLKVFPKNERP